VFQTVLIWIVFLAIGIGSAAAGTWVPLLTWGVGLAIPTVLRGVLVASPGPSSTIVRWASWGVFAVAIVGSAFRDELRAWDGLLVPGITLLAVSYTTAFFWLWSDPSVVRLDG
jgi:hypothetical protein